MREVPVFEAKNKLTALLAEVETGIEIVMTRRGAPVARLVPADSRSDRARTHRAIDGSLALGNTLTLGEGMSTSDLAREGRR
jgi:prevent-host-death family protein